MALPKALRYAVLHVGSSSMSITILEYKGIDDVRVIDYAAREVTFGEELFQTSRLSFKTIEEICHKFSISRSSLQTLFKNNLNMAPKQYISDLKLNKSKLLIKESVYTISEISSKLGFTSIHYFSRKFKQQYGITPTDYAKTIYN